MAIPTMLALSGVFVYGELLSSRGISLVSALALGVGGLAPGAIYAAAPYAAPGQFAVAPTIGLMQQASESIPKYRFTLREARAGVRRTVIETQSTFRATDARSAHDARSSLSDPWLTSEGLLHAALTLRYT